MADPNQMGAASGTMLTTETVEVLEISTSEVVEGDVRLKRRGSWSRFKDSVKETVQGWVGATPNPQQEEGVPSAVFPSTEVTKATINVDKVLHNTNCYSGGKRPSDVGDIPRIVVTCDERPPPEPQRPPRRTSAVQIRHSVSTPDVTEEPVPISQSFPAVRPASPAADPTKPRPVLTEVLTRQSKTQDDITSGSPVIDDEAEIKKKMAVMKIKQAIFSMNNEGGDGGPGGGAPAAHLSMPQLQERRYSDTSAAAAVADSHTPPLNRSPGGSMKRRKSAAPEEKGGGGAAVQRSASMKKPKAKPMIWDHFETLPNTNLQGRCKTCKMNVSCKFNTGNFVRHLQLAHKDVYRQYQNKMETQWTRSMLERQLK